MKSIIEKVMMERKFREKYIRHVPETELVKIWMEISLDRSRSIENKLLAKLDRINNPNNDLEKAKEYPMDEIIIFKHGYAKCLWHNDSYPSLHYYEKTNTAYCFSCGKSFDSIDAAQKVWGLSFHNAINKLIGK